MNAVRCSLSCTDDDGRQTREKQISHNSQARSVAKLYADSPERFVIENPIRIHSSYKVSQNGFRPANGSRRQCEYDGGDAGVCIKVRFPSCD